MSEYVFEGEHKSTGGIVKVRLILFRFKDENDVTIIYSPHLDLSGYGENVAEAKKSFEISFADFIDYTLKKKTFGKILKELGWQVKGNIKKPKKTIAPKLEDILDKNYISEIFDSYNVNTYHKEVNIPAFV